MSRQAGKKATVLSEVKRKSVFGPVSTVALPASPTVYLTLDMGYLPPGVYTATASWFVGTDSANTTYWFDVHANGLGSPVGAVEEVLTRAGVQAPRHSEVELPWPGGDLLIEHVFARAAGSGNVTMYRALHIVAELVKI